LSEPHARNLVVIGKHQEEAREDALRQIEAFSAELTNAYDNEVRESMNTLQPNVRCNQNVVSLHYLEVAKSHLSISVQARRIVVTQFLVMFYDSKSLSFRGVYGVHPDSGFQA
jgi:hypothetical protein